MSETISSCGYSNASIYPHRLEFSSTLMSNIGKRAGGAATRANPQGASGTCMEAFSHMVDDDKQSS